MFETIIKLTQDELKVYAADKLRKIGYETVSKSGFLYAAGSIPVLLVAHLDTVHKKSVVDICYSNNKIVMSPQGIGGDDRCGIYMILKIVQELKCHVLFTEDEEIGGKGAMLFTKSDIIPDINYIIELDRQGSNDAVFYDCNNPEFTKFITSYDFKEEFGTFSDISIIAPYLKIAAVNISVGYYNQHNAHEYIDLNIVYININRIRKIIKKKTPKYEYIESKISHEYHGLHSFDDFDYYNLTFDNCDNLDVLFMPINENDGYLKIDSEFYEIGDNDYYLGEDERIYNFDLYTGEMIKLDNASAFSHSGAPLRFKEEDAFSFLEICEYYGLE